MLKKRPDLLSLIVYLVIAVVDVALLYLLAYAPEQIAMVGGWPLWYLVCCIGGGVVSLGASAWIIFRVYKDSDFEIPESGKEGKK